MRVQEVFFKLILAKVFIGLLLTATIAAAQEGGSVKKMQITLPLGESTARINVYEKSSGGAKITFFAPHHNEQTGLAIAKEMIAAKGGRLVEIESVDDGGKPVRRLRFSVKGAAYSLDPNRIFTENGRACSNFSGEAGQAVKDFAEALLKIILAAESGSRLRAGEKFLVAVHNNADVDAPGKSESDRERDLTAHAFVKGGRVSAGVFHEQADGVYLSNKEADADNFIFLSTPAFVSFFAEKGFHVVVQKSAAELETRACGIDDGSLSVYTGKQNIAYINLEADISNGAARQRQMLEAVYELSQKSAAAQPAKSEPAGRTGRQ